MPTYSEHFLRTTKEFCRKTTVHGIFYFVGYKLHFTERIFWLIVISIATVGAIGVSLSNWRRYTANPTVVSIEKDFRNWNNPFPAATGCLVDKVDEIEADEYIMKTWGVNETNPKYDYYMSFIAAVANVSFKSLDVFEKFRDDTALEVIDMLDLATKVHPEIEGTLVTFHTKHKSNWELVLTENGICFTVNSRFAKHFYLPSLSNRAKNNNGKRSSETLRCHYLNGLCYARYDSGSDIPINFYIHSYLDIVHATIEPPWYVGSSQELEINYRMQETVSDSSLRSLSPSQRRCRFEDEPVSEDLPAYSTSICYITCRYRKIIELCGCKPFFYSNFNAKTCDLDGLLCVAKFSKVIIEPPPKLGCNCPQPCHVVQYLPQTPKLTVWEYGYFDQRITFRWGLLSPTTKYRRNILFSFEDLIVSFGGTAALFLGVSFISFIELIYYLLKCIFKF